MVWQIWLHSLQTFEYVYCWTFIKILSLYIARRCKCIHFGNGARFTAISNCKMLNLYSTCTAHIHTHTEIIHIYSAHMRRTQSIQNPIHTKVDAKQAKKKINEKRLKINAIWTTTSKIFGYRMRCENWKGRKQRDKETLMRRVEETEWSTRTHNTAHNTHIHFDCRGIQ